MGKKTDVYTTRMNRKLPRGSDEAASDLPGEGTNFGAETKLEEIFGREGWWSLVCKFNKIMEKQMPPMGTVPKGVIYRMPPNLPDHRFLSPSGVDTNFFADRGRGRLEAYNVRQATRQISISGH